MTDAAVLDRTRRPPEPGAHRVADGVHRIPLPLPMDGLRAVNVYAIETEAGLTLVDGGWAVEESRAQLEESLSSIGHRLSDITRFLVTHVHRDHYTQALAVRREFGSHVSLGLGEKPTLDVVRNERLTRDPTVPQILRAGAEEVARDWADTLSDVQLDLALWEDPDSWLEGDHRLAVGTRTLDAVSTRGTRRATSSSPTSTPGCCSPATTCCRPSRRRSGSSRRTPTSRSATSSAPSPRSARCRTCGCCPPTVR